MKKSTLAVLSMAAVAGFAGMANAAPLGINELAQSGAGGTAVSETARTIGASASQNAQNGGLGSQNALTTNSASVPVSGSTLMLFGAGFVALAIWHRRYRGGWAA